jgi:hypothetical protein
MRPLYWHLFALLLSTTTVMLSPSLRSSLDGQELSGRYAAPLREIVAGMAAYHQWQGDALREYEAHSRMYASKDRSTTDATVEVRTVFNWPHTLQSTVLRQEGSSFLREQVLAKILAAETDMAVKDQTDIIPQNYDFSYLSSADCAGERCWHLNMKPKNKDKYMLEGEVWVSAMDYGVYRAHGSPSKRVSLWVSKVDIDKRWRRIQGVWLPERVESSMNIRLGGNVRMQIDYTYDNLKIISR